MKPRDLLSSLYHAECQRITNELRYQFSLSTEIAEDLVGDTFLSATESWDHQGLPQNPVGWLHTVARNKARNYLKKKTIFDKKLCPELRRASTSEEIELDIREKCIDDCQLAMIFTVCHPMLSNESQVGLALHLVCGMGIHEIADAFSTTRHVIYKRLERAKEKLKVKRIEIGSPTADEIRLRMDNVLTILYLLFSGAHFTLNQSTSRETFSAEAMRLNYLLISQPETNTSAANALFALMCFHASRFAAWRNGGAAFIAYDVQDDTHLDNELISKGCYHLHMAAADNEGSKFHLEAAIAYWHTFKDENPHKWENILILYNRLLEIEYSPMAAINRAYALAKVKGKAHAIMEAESLQLTDNLHYHSLLSFLYDGVDETKALQYSLYAASASNFNSQKLAAA